MLSLTYKEVLIHVMWQSANSTQLCLLVLLLSYSTDTITTGLQRRHANSAYIKLTMTSSYCSMYIVLKL